MILLQRLRQISLFITIYSNLFTLENFLVSFSNHQIFSKIYFDIGWESLC